MQGGHGGGHYNPACRELLFIRNRREERGSEEMRIKKRTDGKIEEKKKEKRSRGSA